MRDEGKDIGKGPILDLNLSEDQLELTYGQMASILLQLFRLKFPRISSFIEKKDGIPAGSRPLIQNVNDLIKVYRPTTLPITLSSLPVCGEMVVVAFLPACI